MLLIWSCDINVYFGNLYRPQTDLGAVKEVIFKLREKDEETLFECQVEVQFD